MGGSIYGIDDLNIAGNLDVLGNITVSSINITSGDTLYLGFLTMENEGTHTTVDTDFIITVESEATSFLGVHAHNESVLAHANLVLVAGELGNSSAFNLVKNGPLHPFSPNASGILNEGGSYGTFVEHDFRVSWNGFTSLNKDDEGNIENLTGIITWGFLNETGLYINGSINFTGKLSGDGSGLTGIIATPGGSTNQVQYNNGGVLGGILGVTVDSGNELVMEDSFALNFGTDLDAFINHDGSTAFKLSNSLGQIFINNADTSSPIRFQIGTTTNTTSFDFKDSSANMLMTILGSGQVGIGTKVPTQKLDVNGSINITGVYYGDGSELTGIESLWTNSSGAATYVEGNVGIGTLTPSGLFTIGGGASYDISDSTFIQNISTASQAISATGLAFSKDGTKMFVISANTDHVYEYDLSTSFDITTFVFVQNFSIVAQDAAPRGLAFNDDGTKMYFPGNVGDRVYEYNLTNAYDISTAFFTQSFDFKNNGNLENVPLGLTFSEDGTKMFVEGNSKDGVDEFDLSSAFDISTSVYVQSFSFSAKTITPRGIKFSPDGTEMFIGATDICEILRYDLSDAFNVSTSVFTQSFDITDQGCSPTGIDFNSDGTILFYLTLGGIINEYDLGGSLLIVEDNGDLIVDFNTLFVDASNNRVGIGTTSPTQDLEVDGNLNVTEISYLEDISMRGTINNATLSDDNTLLNLLVGANVGAAITTGSQNTAVGHEAFLVGTSGGSNTAIGYQALFTTTTGFSNIAIGGQALNFNTIGNDNTAIGEGALFQNIEGDRNTAIGALAGLDVVSAAGTGDNTFIGHHAGRGITTGIQNTIIGANVVGLSSTLSNNVILADGAGVARLQFDSSGDGTIGGSLDVLGVIGTSNIDSVGAMDITSASTFVLDIVGNATLTSLDFMKIVGTNGITLADDTTITGDLTVDNDTLFVDSDNDKVGIGTTSPDNKLHVYNAAFQVGSFNNIVGNRLIIDAGGNIEHTYGLNDGSSTGLRGRFQILNNVNAIVESGNDAGGYFVRNNGGRWAAIIGGGSSAGALKFFTGGTSTNQDYDSYSASLAMTIDSEGSVIYYLYIFGG